MILEASDWNLDLAIAAYAIVRDKGVVPKIEGEVNKTSSDTTGEIQYITVFLA